jgi:hypothetical protein
VKALTASTTSTSPAQMAQSAKDYELKVTSEKSELLKEWGGGHERMMAAAKSAATTLGFTAR